MFNDSHTTRKITQSLALVTLTTLFLATCGSNSSEAADDAITSAVVPAESSQSLQSDYDNLVKLTARETGKGVEFQNASDYVAIVEDQHAGRTDIAPHDPFSHVVAHDSGVLIEAVASPTNDGSEAPAYTSLACVKGGSGIESLEDFKDKKVCFVDPASTSGYLIPTKRLMDEGLKLDADLEPVMAGGYGASLLTPSGDGCDMASARGAMLKTLEKSNRIKPDTSKPIRESEPITGDPIAFNTETISAGDLAKIKTALSDKANRPALVKEGVRPSEGDFMLSEEIEWGYLLVTDADLNFIREICETTKADVCSAAS